MLKLRNSLQNSNTPTLSTRSTCPPIFSARYKSADTKSTVFKTDSNITPDPVAQKEIREKISALKVSELNDLMRSCGLTQGTGKENKIASLSAFIWDAQNLALQRYLAKSKSKRVPQSMTKIHAEFVPDEVISMDIGFRNLAFAHVSRTGEVLGWKRTELLKEATFEPWTLAPSISSYIIEHQRFRSQGSAAVTNSIMVNNLVEALLYSNLRHIGAVIHTVNPAIVSTEWEPYPDDENDDKPNSTADKLTKKTAVTAARGSDKRDKRESSTPETSASVGGVSQTNQKKQKLITNISQMDKILCELKQITKNRHSMLLSALGRSPSRARASKTTAARDTDELMQKEKEKLSTLRDLRRRLIKKERTISIVQAWILASIVSQKKLLQQACVDKDKKFLGDVLAPGSAVQGMWPFEAGRHITFTSDAAEMFCDEKKKDDLCDCLVQAVAWYKWQESTIAILEQYGSAQIVKVGPFVVKP
ncbi:hypothetical protein BX070DRAFT_228186 [Coemansia spiralis]|nr:hypothetical protein BX070DRAFT_228186 [Coemansia spiralis]